MEPMKNKMSKPKLIYNLTALIVSLGICIIFYYVLKDRISGYDGGFGLKTLSAPQVSLMDILMIWKTTMMKPLILFLLMIVGMIFNQLFEILQKRKNKGQIKVNLKTVFSEAFSGIAFWMAILVSPIIFFSTYYFVNSLPDNTIAYFYAFQNGFFWHNIFYKTNAVSN